MATRRKEITNRLVELIKQIDGTAPYATNLFENVYNRAMFMDEIKDYPTVCVWPSAESRQYLPGDFQWAFLGVNIRIYIESGNPVEDLENAFVDIENLLDQNNTLMMEDGQHLCTDIRVLSISDDEGLFMDQGYSIGEMSLQIQYSIE